MKQSETLTLTERPYIDKLAVAIFKKAHHGGLPTSGPTGDFPLYRMYALLARAKGVMTTAADVHDAWSAWIAGIAPEHRSLKPFHELAPEVQRADDLYVDAIHAVATDPVLGFL